jgi:hypothetical protein
MRAFVLLLILFVAPVAAAAPKGAEKKQARAMKLFELGKYKEAAQILRDTLDGLDAQDKGSPLERDVRSRLVLALFSAGDKTKARSEYRTLREHFPSFRFDPDQVFPEVIAFFEQAEPPTVVAAPTSAPVITVAPDAPRQIEIVATAPVTSPATRTWHWYYLAPLGIGQFLAGSPVRGAILLALELGFIAMNVAGFVLLEQQRGGSADRTVTSLAQANTARAIMNTGFFGMLGTFAFGIVDGAALEP